MSWRIVFSLMPWAVWLLAVAMLIRPMKLSPAASFGLAAFCGVALAKFAGFLLIGGEMFNPQLTAFVIYAWGTAYGFVELWVGLASFVWLTVSSFRRRRGYAGGSRTARRVALTTAALAAILCAEGLYQTLRTPRVVERELRFRDLPPAFQGYRIVQLSDLHASVATSRERFERIVGRVNRLDADMVAITGDFADGFASEMKPLLSPLAELRAKDGVFGCAGNHEHYWDWSSMRPELVRMGIAFPERPVEIDRGGACLRIASLDDPARDRFVVPPPKPDFESVYGPAPRRNGEFRLLLAHRPENRRVLAEKAGVDLQLSGHTHGGMALPLRPLVALFNDGCCSGLYPTPRGFLHVSPGTGQWSGFPLRLMNPTEITVLTLTRHAVK